MGDRQQMLRALIIIVQLAAASSAQAFVAREVVDFDLPGKFETACVQLIMDVDMYWHYTVEGEPFSVSRERVIMSKTNSYEIPVLSPNEAKALSYIKNLHATALSTVEFVLEGYVRQTEYLDKDLEELAYASSRRGIQENMYNNCRTGVYFRLTKLN